MRKLILTLLVAGAAITGACTTTEKPLPAGSDKFPTNSTPTTPSTVVQAAKEAPSSCDVAREALLTGGPAEIRAAMQQLKADKTADAKAREYASEYLTETNASLQEMNVSLIRMLCS